MSTYVCKNCGMKMYWYAYLKLWMCESNKVMEGGCVPPKRQRKPPEMSVVETAGYILSDDEIHDAGFTLDEASWL
jgi:ribosomal protein L37AE/L43A